MLEKKLDKKPLDMIAYVMREVGRPLPATAIISAIATRFPEFQVKNLNSSWVVDSYDKFVTAHDLYKTLTKASEDETMTMYGKFKKTIIIHGTDARPEYATFELI